MESILNEYAVMLKRRQKATRSADSALDSMLSTIRSMRDTLQQPNGNMQPALIHPVKEEPELAQASSIPDAMQIEPSPNNSNNITIPTSESDTASVLMHRLQLLHRATKSLQASLLTDHKSVGAAINKFGRTIDAATSISLADLCAPSVRLNTCKINEAIATHLFREGLFDVGRSFLLEASLLLDDTHIQPFEQLYHILTAFRSDNLKPAIQWAQSNHQLLNQSNSHLEFRLHRLAYLNLLHQNQRTEALKYAQRHFEHFQNHINSVQKLMTCLLYAPNLSKSPYKNLVSPSHKEHIERSLSREYCRALGLPRDSLLVTVVHCGTKAIPMLLKASKLAPTLRELGMDDALPVEVDVGRHCHFHSIFTCPVSKEEAYEGNNAPMILPCGHVLSKQSIARLPRGSPRFKCPYCPMEQNAKECHELRF